MNALHTKFSKQNVGNGFSFIMISMNNDLFQNRERNKMNIVTHVSFIRIEDLNRVAFD